MSVGPFATGREAAKKRIMPMYQVLTQQFHSQGPGSYISIIHSG